MVDLLRGPRTAAVASDEPPWRVSALGMHLHIATTVDARDSPRQPATRPSLPLPARFRRGIPETK